MPEFPNFGAALRYSREHIADRLRQYVPGRMPDVQLTAKQVVSNMREAGYTISPAAYSDIEQGIFLPRDPDDFMDKIVQSLALEKDSHEYHNLMDHLVRDILKQKLGEIAGEYWTAIRSARQRQGQSTKS
jgi:hypothetical protein